jgi:hypothetical protein
MSNIKLLTQADALKAIEIIKTDSHSLQERIHEVAVSTLDHIRAHGDTTGACALLNALPKGQRVKALAFWFKRFSNSKAIFLFDKAAGVWNCKLSKQRVDSDFTVAEAMATTFADLTEEREPTSVTVESMMRNLIRNATNTDNHDGTEIPKVDAKARELAAFLVKAAREAGYDKKAGLGDRPVDAAAA